MNRQLRRSIALIVAMAFAASLMFSIPANAIDQDPKFLGRGGAAYETQVNNANGSATVTTVAVGGGIKTVGKYGVDDLAVDFMFNADTVANLPASNQYVLSFTDIQQATPNGDDSIGFYFVIGLHSPDEGLQGIIADITPYKKPTTGGAAGSAGTSRYIPLNGNSTFHIVKKISGLYTISISNAYYAENAIGNRILFDDVDLSGCIPSTGVYVNMYLAAGSNFTDSHTIDVTGTAPAAGKFIGRGGAAYETSIDNANGSSTVTTVVVGGGIKTVSPYGVSDLAVDFTFNADTVANLPANNQYVLSFTNVQHATPNGDDSIGFYFVIGLHSPDEGLQGIIADITPYKKPTTGGAAGSAGTSRYIPLNGISTFHIVKKESGLFTISISNAYYAENTIGNRILFDDVDLSGCIPSTGVYVNMYLAAGSNFADSHTVDVTGTAPDPTINGMLPYGATALTASGTTAVSFTDPTVGQGAYTSKRVALDNLEITMRYDGNIGDANGYLLAFSNVAGGNMLSNEVRQKGFYFVIRFHDNLGVADGNSVTSGVIIRENVKKDANGLVESFPASEKTTVFEQGKFFRISDTLTYTFRRVGTEGQIYDMYYKDNYSQTEDLLFLDNADLSDYLDADGCMYVNYFFADQQQADQDMTFTFGVDGIYTDAPAEEMPDIIEEGDPITLEPINSFIFVPAEVLNANAAALSYNGLTMTGKTFRTAALQTIPLAVDDFEFELTTAAGAASGSYYQISFSKTATVLARDEASVGTGFIFTMQCGSDAYSGIYNIFGWSGNQSLGAGVSKRFTDDVTARMKITKDEGGTYTLWYKGDDALAYEAALTGLNLEDCIGNDGKAYFSIKTMDSLINANYSVSLLTLPVPASIAQAAIDDTLSLTESDYTPESWQAFADARTALQAAIDGDVTDINGLFTTFKNALLDLQEQDPIVLLYEQLLLNIESNFNEDEALTESDYTSASWAAFTTAKETLNTWYLDGAGYDTLIVYFDAYIAAKDALVTADVQTGDASAAWPAVLLLLSAVSVLALATTRRRLSN